MIRSTFDFKYYQRRDNDAITWNDSNIISIANMTVWLERIRNAHTHTYTFIKMDDPHFSFFSSLSLSLICFDQRDLIDKHTHTRIQEKKLKGDCYDYIRREKCTCPLCDYYRLILCFISSIQGGSSTQYVKRETKKNGMGKAIKNYCLAWKTLLIDVM